MRVKKILTLVFLFLFIIGKSSFIFAQAPPTPTPTYTPFEDTSSQRYNIPNSIQRLFDESGFACGSVGQRCCGKTVSLQLERIGDFLSGTFFSLLPGSSGIWRVLSFLPTVVIRTVLPVMGFMSDLPSRIFQIEERGYCAQGYPSNELDPERCTCVSSTNISAARLCGVLTSNSEQSECFNNCMKDGRGVWTALGCFSSDLSTLIKEKVFGLGVGLAGTISLLCIIYAAFQIQTSAGNAEKVKKAQELLTSCIMGLMLIIFSVFILRLIGVNILKIPRFR